MLATLFKIYDKHSTSAGMKFIRLHFTTQYNLILLLYATKFVLSTKNILKYIFITRNDINPKLPNTEPTEHPT